MKRIVTGYTWVLFLPALLPLFYVEGMMYPLLAPKIFALRAFGIIAFALVTYLVFAGHAFYWHRLRAWVTWIPAALLAVAYLSSMLGVDFYRSFWSTFERGDGLLTLTVCVEYFYLFLLSATTAWLPRLFRIVAWTGSLAALYLVLQWLVTLDVLTWSFIVSPNGRIGGTMGNAAFLAAYLGMTFIATLPTIQTYEGWRRRLLLAGAGLQLFAILLSGTRGTQLALVGVGMAALLYIAMKNEGRARKYARIALISGAMLLGILFAFRTQLAQVPFEPIQRIATTSLTDATVSSRLFIWNTVSKEALKHPLLGYGAEHISVPFDRVYDPSVMKEEWFDRSHNAYLDYAVQFGLGGLVLYLALIALVLRVGWKLAQRGSHYGYYIVGIAGVYAVQNFFVFDTAMTLWLLFALLGVALAQAHADEKEKKPSVCGYPQPILGACVGMLILFFTFPAVLQPIRANRLAFEAYQYQIVDVARANAAAQEGLSLGTYADLEFGYNAYFIYTEEQRHRLTGEDLVAAYQSAVALLANAFNRYPYDARTAVYLAQTLSLAPEGMSADSGLLSQALERSIRLSPKRAQPWYILANLSISQANEYPVGSKERVAGYASAKDILNKYITLVPGLSEPHFVLAQLERAAGNTAAAAISAETGRASYAGSLEAARRAAGYYVGVSDWENAKFFLSEIVRAAPTDEASLYDLAKVIYLTGDLAGAEEIVAELRISNPTLLATDPDFLAAITAYESR